MDDRAGLPTDRSEALRRGLDRLEAQGAALLEQERAEAAEREQQLRAEWNAKLFQAEDRAVEKLAPLAEKYAQLAAAAEVAHKAAVEVHRINSEIVGAVSDIGGIVRPFYARFGAILVNKSWRRMRERAGLNAVHGLPIELAERTEGEKAAAKAVRGLIGE